MNLSIFHVNGWERNWDFWMNSENLRKWNTIILIVHLDKSVSDVSFIKKFPFSIWSIQKGIYFYFYYFIFSVLSLFRIHYFILWMLFRCLRNKRLILSWSDFISLRSSTQQIISLNDSGWKSICLLSYVRKIITFSIPKCNINEVTTSVEGWKPIDAL